MSVKKAKELASKLSEKEAMRWSGEPVASPPVSFRHDGSRGSVGRALMLISRPPPPSSLLFPPLLSPPSLSSSSPVLLTPPPLYCLHHSHLSECLAGVKLSAPQGRAFYIQHLMEENPTMPADEAKERALKLTEEEAMRWSGEPVACSLHSSPSSSDDMMAICPCCRYSTADCWC